MKKAFKTLLLIILVFLIIFAGGMLYLYNGLNRDIHLTGLNLSNINDGIYMGKYVGQRWTNELEVIIKDQRITDIVIVKDVTFVKPGVSDELFEKVKIAQNTTIDTVSEATVTSKAYLKSIENAINN